MEDAQRFLNPWVLNSQKLGLELKCPLCLNLFNRPMLLPCNHIFCNFCIPKSTQFGSECPSCKHQYVDPEVRPAPYMENIVTIYRNLDATFSANLFQPVCSDVGRVSELCSGSFKTNINDNSRKEHVEIPHEGNSSNGQSISSQTAIPGCAEDVVLLSRKSDKCTTPESGQKQEFMTSCRGSGVAFIAEDKSTPFKSTGLVVAEKHTEVGAEGIGVIQMEQLSPPSSDSKDMDGNSSDPGISNRSAEKYSAKRLVENESNRAGMELNNRCTSTTNRHAIDVKRQKKLGNELFDTGLQSDGQIQTKVFLSEKLAASDCKLDSKFEKSLSGEQSAVISDRLNFKRSPCAFCHSSKQTDGTGPLLCYANGMEVAGNAANFSKAIHVHEKCIGWAPRIFFEDGIIRNLQSEVARANKLKCSSCGRKGAGLGCYVKTCHKTYHVPCAYEIRDVRWDCDAYLLLCPKHQSLKFPSEEQTSKSGMHAIGKRVSTQSNSCTVLPNGGNGWVFCGSALSPEEKHYLVEFARTCGATVSKYWRPNVTHVIAATDADCACTRTLKVLMGILNGRWILTMEWVKACVEAGNLVNEEAYEVSLDNHGCSGGPKAGRLRVSNNAPKLFSCIHFCFSGEFVQAFKNDLQNLVKTAGGTIIESKEQLWTLSNDSHTTPTTLVVYNTDLSDHSMFGDEDFIKLQRLAAAEELAQEFGSRVIEHTWILESIAACSLQAFDL